jgi:hypothetical protein
MNRIPMSDLNEIIKIQDESERLKNEKDEALEKSCANPQNQSLHDDYEKKRIKYQKHFDDNKHIISAQPLK